MSKQFQGFSLESFISLSKELVNNINFHFGEQKVLSKKIKSSITNAELLAKLYAIIISHRKDDYCLTYSDQNVKLNGLEKIIWYSHILYKKRLFDNATHLDKLLNILHKKGFLAQHCDVRVVLQFLSYLIDAGFYTKEDSQSFPTPWEVSSDMNVGCNLPSGPLNYNDSRLHYLPSRWHYTHFPSYLFEIEMLSSISGISSFSINFNSCRDEPGKSLQYNFFQNEEKSFDNCLGGALIGPKKCHVSSDTELFIPDLPNIPDAYSFVPFFLSQYVDKGSNYQSFENQKLKYCDAESSNTLFSSPLPIKGTLDEGYVSSQGSCGEKFPSNCSDIWEAVLESSSLSNHYTWESVGNAFAQKEKPFISESGHETTYKFWMINFHNLSNLTNSYPNSPFLKVTLEALCSDIIHMLMGIPSSCFTWNKILECFEVNVVYCQGITPESIQLQIKSFLKCGNQIKRLESFVNQMEQYSEKDNGFVFRAFAWSIKDILYVYRKKIFSLLGEDKILALKLRTEKLISRIRFLYNLCFSTVTEAGIPYKGLSLIGVLKNEFLLIQQESNSFMLLSLLSASCKPFFRFLEKWLYEGELYDPASEFMVYCNIEALQLRDRSYWLNGYYYNHVNLKKIPEVLKNVLIQAFHCGKSLNFLRTFDPKNFLLQRGCIPYPKITLCMTTNDVEITRKKCHNYSCQMKNNNSCITFKKYDDAKEKKPLPILNTYRERPNTVHQLSEDSIPNRKVEEKKLALEKAKADLEQAKGWKILEEIKIQEEDLKIQKLYEKTMQENNDKDSAIKNDLKDYYLHYMNSLEEREVDSRHYLKGLSEDIADVIPFNPLEEESPQISHYSLIDTLSQMSITSDSLDTPMIDEMPDNLEDCIHEVDKIENLVNTNIKGYGEVNNNPLFKNSAEIDLEMMDTITHELCLESPPDKVKASKKPSHPRPLSETVEYVSDVELLMNDEGSRSCKSIRRSKSETFHTIDNVRIKRKGLESSLSNLCESETPVIVDTTPKWDVNDNLPETRFTDNDLLLNRILKPSHQLLPYSAIKLGISDLNPIEDISEKVLGGGTNYVMELGNVAEEITFPSSALLVATHTSLVQALSIHVSTQTQLVNETILSYLLIHEHLIDHFSVIKSLLLLDDGSFARPLAASLYNKFVNNKCMPMLFNPADLNGLLHEAVAASQLAKSPFADNLSFVLTNIPSSITVIYNPLEHIHLHYQVKWPCCVIFDDSVFDTYGRIWKFLIKLHYVVWAVDDIFKYTVFLDRDPLYNGMKTSIHFHRISIYRFEIHQLIGILFNYFVHQGIQGGWINFLSDLHQKVSTLDDLYAAHLDLLNNVIEKCFLTGQAKIVYDILQSIFDKILTFHTILLSHTWIFNSTTNQQEHPQFSSLQRTYQEIKQLLFFFNKLALKILNWNYSDHLSDLVDQLSFSMTDRKTTL